MNWHIISADVGTSIISLSPKTELNQFPKRFTEKRHLSDISKIAKKESQKEQNHLRTIVLSLQ